MAASASRLKKFPIVPSARREDCVNHKCAEFRPIVVANPGHAIRSDWIDAGFVDTRLQIRQKLLN
jgi:hypothetical protein